MDIGSWSAVAGLLLLVLALSDSVLARLPVSTSMIYLAIGAAMSPLWLDWVQLAPLTHAHALERIAEVVLLLSLFGSGLKMSVGLSDGRWLLPLRLATVAMVVTIALIAARRRSHGSVCRSAPRSCSAASSRRPTRCSRRTCRSPSPRIATGCASRSRAKPA